MGANDTLQCDVKKTGSDAEGNKVTTVTCHGRLVSETGGELKSVVKPLIQGGGRIVVDMGGVSYMDSSGLGALVGLKASAINHGYCILEFENMTPRILELLRITNLTQMFTK
jgi:anti-anti-sigma factor